MDSSLPDQDVPQRRPVLRVALIETTRRKREQRDTLLLTTVDLEQFMQRKHRVLDLLEVQIIDRPVPGGQDVGEFRGQQLAGFLEAAAAQLRVVLSQER